MTTETKAKTYDNGKAPLAMLPWAGLREVAAVQQYGADKYGAFHNYRKGMEVSRNLSCAMRHIADFMDGRDLDAESGRSHLGHAACRILFVLQNLADGTAIDDRYAKPADLSELSGPELRALAEGAERRIEPSVPPKQVCEQCRIVYGGRYVSGCDWPQREPLFGRLVLCD